MEWKGKVVVVTGAGSGIGAATAALFAERGAAVMLADVNGDAAAGQARAIVAKGAQAQAVRCDVSSREEAAALADKTLSAFGRIDVLVNNAGILLRHDRLEEWTLEEFRRVVDINLNGMFIVGQAVVPHLIRAGGVMVNTASVGGIYPVAHALPYAASKAGVLGLTRTLAVMLAPHKVRVNAILPMLVDTPMTRDSSSELRRTQPGGALQPLDIARGILYAAGDASLSGAFIVVNNSPEGAWLSRVEDPPAQTRLSVSF